MGTGGASRGALIALLLVLAALQLGALGLAPLQEPDEGRYAEIAAGMVRSGDWIIPRLSGIPYYEKPPLVFWTAAVAMELFGQTAFAARLPSALAALAIATMLAFWGRRALGGAVSLMAPVILLTCPLVALLSRALLVDFVLAALVSGALLAAWRGLIQPAPGAAPRRGAVRLFWLLAGLAFLAKGPVGLALPGAAVGSYLLLTRQWDRVRTLLSPGGPLLFVAVVAPWYVAMSLRQPGYAYGFFIEQNLQRFTTGGSFDRQQPLWYYPAVLLLGSFPWGLLVPAALLAAWRARKGSDQEHDRLRLFLGCAVMAPLLLLSVASSKLAYYLLPILPPLALLLADTLWTRLAPAAAARADDAAPDPAVGRTADRARGCRLGAAFAGVLLVTLAAGLLWIDAGDDAVIEARLPRDLIALEPGAESLATAHTAIRRLAVLSGGAGLLALLGVAMAARRRPAAGFALLASGLLAAGAGLPWLLDAVGPALSARPIAELVAQHAGPDEPVLDFGHFYRSVPFYLGRPVSLWMATHAEFGWDVEDAAPGLALQFEPEALAALVATHGSVLAFTTDARYENWLTKVYGPLPPPLARLCEVTLWRLEAP